MQTSSPWPDGQGLFRCARPGAVVGSDVGGEAVGELVIAAVLKEAPHRPDEPLIGSAGLDAVPDHLPAQGVAAEKIVVAVLPLAATQASEDHSRVTHGDFR